ncbi:MAG: exo-alpha-sialidase [Verrucomicrobia bacterium]|nr:exo-alpha-sialidase [Verrucomicrobiota bacterium]
MNPRLLSGGLLLARESTGLYGHRVPPRAARTGPADLSKGQPPAVLDARVGPNVRLGADPTALPAGQTAQAESHVVRSLTDPDLLLATFQEGRYTTNGGAVSNGYALSRDGGFTWQRGLVPQLTRSTGGAYRRATDPVAAIGPQGDLYLNSLASADDAFGTADIVLSRSTDGGATWSAPLMVFRQTSAQASPDKNWIAVNEFSGTPAFSRLACSWTNFTTDARGSSTGNNIILALSDDRGTTWTSPIAVTPAGTINQGSLPLFLPDGSLLVVFLTLSNPNNPALFSVQCKRSTDGGRTFPAVATTIAANVNGWDDPDLRNGMLVPQADVARQNGAIVVTCNAVIAGTPRVLVTRSTDQGATWSAPVVASDNPDGISVTNPAIAVTPDGATVTVIFTDKRLSPVAPDGHRYFVDHYAAQSFDGGATWQPNLRLSEMSSDVRYAPLTSQGYMLGDYIGVTALFTADQPCVAIWCDTRRGDADPFSVRIAPVKTADFAAWSAVHGLPAAGALPDLVSDADGDGEEKYFEFLSGSNPRNAEDGEPLFVRRTTPAITDVFWLERTGIQKIPISDGVAWANAATLGQSNPFSMSAAVAGNVPADQFPATTPPSGLAWQGARFTFDPNPPVAFARAIKYSTGLPVTPSKLIATSAADSRLVNLSTRGQVGTGANQLIVGFVLDGNKSMLVRAAGPALSALGVPGALADPSLTLEAPASDLSRANDNWQQGTATVALFARLGAFPFAANSLDAALALSLGAQSYSALVSGAGASTGIALVEAYDADPAPGAPANPRLVNLSTRGNAGTGDNALIAGFVLSGTQPRRVLIRAVGPSLATVGVDGALADPQLELFRGTQRIAANDDWEISRSSAAIAATAQRVGAFPLAATSLDAALLLTLAPGSYTVVVTGVDGATGLALVEIYDAD